MYRNEKFLIFTSISNPSVILTGVVVVITLLEFELQCPFLFRRAQIHLAVD